MPRRIDPLVTALLAFVHVGALAAPFWFTWAAFGLFLTLSAVTGLAVTLGYHRLLTHSSFKTYPAVRYGLAWLGGVSGQGGVIQWVTDHRAHHKYADDAGDPHSPLDGFWHAHIAWTLPKRLPSVERTRQLFYCPELCNDATMQRIQDWFLPSQLAMGFACWAIAGWPGVVWGMFARLVYVFHSTWFVNSCAHKYGYRSFNTRDDSTNLWWVALTTFGEGWHNNHHAFPTSAKHGLKRWELDPTYWVILAMQWAGLAWDIKKPRTQSSRVRGFDED